MRGIMALRAFMSTPSCMSGLLPSPRLTAAALVLGLISSCFRRQDLLVGDACVEEKVPVVILLF